LIEFAWNKVVHGDNTPDPQVVHNHKKVGNHCPRPKTINLKP